MKKIYSLIICIILSVTLIGTNISAVWADETTLSSLTVQAKDADGNLTDLTLSPAFSPEIKEYNATAQYGTTRLEIAATPTATTATYETDWLALDQGDNQSYVYVTGADGTKTTYTIYTKVLAEGETAPTDNDTSSNQNSEPVTVKVNKLEMKISSDFTSADIPEGFVKTKTKYKKKSVTAIKGERKDLIAMWLVNISNEGEDSEKNEEGFYIYDKEAKTFYLMNNIQIKSRMYTIMEPAEPDDFLKDYEAKTITVIDRDIDTWVLDEENSLYLVYAMNWNGDFGLYCYDDIEKCFQRYIVDDQAGALIEAANDAINNLQDRNNELVKKYNQSNSMKWKIIALLLVIIVILFFVCLNISLKFKTKKLTDSDLQEENHKKEKKSKKKNKKVNNEANVTDELNDEEESEEFVNSDNDFVIIDDAPLEESGNISDDIEISSDEIDISEQIIKELEEASEKKANAKQVKLHSKTGKIDAEELKDALTSAFPKEDKDNDDDDDDGFTFI